MESEHAILKKIGLDYKIQDKEFISAKKDQDWIKQHSFEKILIYFDLDVLDPNAFRLQYFSEPHTTEFSVPHGKMTFHEVSDYFSKIQEVNDIVGLTIAKFLPWDIINLCKNLSAWGMDF